MLRHTHLARSDNYERQRDDEKRGHERVEKRRWQITRIDMHPWRNVENKEAVKDESIRTRACALPIRAPLHGREEEWREWGPRRGEANFANFERSTVDDASS